jgi:aminoglycoside 6'-N-acetyltransferase I
VAKLLLSEPPFVRHWWHGTVAGVGPPLVPGVALREAIVGDIPILVELARAFYDEDGFTASDADLEKNFTMLVPTTHARVVVVISEGQLCGFALTTVGFTLESGAIAELQDLYVRPRYRRQGLAGLLIEDAVDWARRRSASLVDLVVAPNGRDVGHLLTYYESRGFVDDGRRVLSRPLS